MGSTLAGTFIVIVLMLDIAYLLVDRSIERKKTDWGRRKTRITWKAFIWSNKCRC